MRLTIRIRGFITQDKRFCSQRPVGSGLQEVDALLCRLQLLIAIAIQPYPLFVKLQRLFQVKVFCLQGLDDFLEALQGLLEGQIGHCQTPSVASHPRCR